MKYYENITQLIGKTPIVKLNNLKEQKSLYGNIYAKIEAFNPGGSIKDRIALALIEDAEASGALKSDTVIYEPTSGNTGIGAALVGAAKGYEVVIVMPDKVSVERIKLVKAYGAKVILTEGSLGMKGAIAKVESLMSENKNSITLAQFENPINPKAHYQSTAVEIYKDMNKQVDVFVAGVGTGGTISGVGKYLKEKNAEIEVVAVEPKDSQVLKTGVGGPHKIQGIGAGFVPKTLNTEIYDQIIAIDYDLAVESTRLLAASEGILAGISAGAALAAALMLAEDVAYKDKNIVVVLPDTGERYLSLDVFAG